MKQIDTGGLPFAEIRKGDKYYVDKTMLIADILSTNDRGVYLYTRPRRFGKTMNLTMLDAFFNLRFQGNTWFDGLEISEHHEFDRYMNAFPVVYINLKEAKASSYPVFVKRMNAVLYNAYDRHRYLLESEAVPDDEKAMFREVLGLSVEEAFIRDRIPLLCRMLEQHYGTKVVILIDEYDRAVSDAFGSESHRPIMDLLGEFLNSALKSNDSLQMAYVTGVMQIANESIFSDLNNIEVNNIFSKASDERFGFTEDEVKAIFSDYGHPERFAEAKQWYDGYRFGDAEVYNPYSIMRYVSAGFEPDTYWANSGGDKVMRWLLERIGGSGFSNVVSLVTGGSVDTELYAAITYKDVERGTDIDLFSLMAMSGYLKAVPADDGLYAISVPDEEVRTIIDRLMRSLRPVDTSLFADFSNALLSGNATGMTGILQRILVGGSYYNLKENGYEVMLMTILWSLSRKYEVSTERDSGNGRTDVLMKPRAEGDPAVVMELKTADSEDDLDKELDEAFGQIHDRRYYAGIPGKVILVGISFFVKTPKVRVEVIDNGPDGFGYKGASV